MDKSHKLYKYLEHQGTSQRRFSKKINITPNNLHLILRGKRSPSLKLAIAIEEATGGLVSVYDLAEESSRLSAEFEDVDDWIKLFVFL